MERKEGSYLSESWNRPAGDKVGGGAKATKVHRLQRTDRAFRPYDLPIFFTEDQTPITTSLSLPLGTPSDSYPHEITREHM